MKQGYQNSLQVVSGYSGFHSSRFTRIRPDLEWREDSVPFDLWKELRAFSRVSIGETDLLLRFDGKIGIPLKSKQENRPSSQDEVGNMGFFSSCGGKLGVPLKSSSL